jgi:hypothetical protein
VLIGAKSIGVCGQGKVTDMDPRRFQKDMHGSDDAVEPGRDMGLPNSPRSRTPKGPERTLSVDAVMDDMRAILWPDDCEQIPAEVDPVSKTCAQDKSLLAQD